MTKEERHQKSSDFRNEITAMSSRRHAIDALSKKSSLDESDEVRLMVLFSKSAYLTGCEAEYQFLIEKIRRTGKAELISKTESFAKKLQMCNFKCDLKCHI